MCVCMLTVFLKHFFFNQQLFPECPSSSVQSCWPAVQTFEDQRGGSTCLKEIQFVDVSDDRVSTIQSSFYSLWKRMDTTRVGNDNVAYFFRYYQFCNSEPLIALRAKNWRKFFLFFFFFSLFYSNVQQYCDL